MKLKARTVVASALALGLALASMVANSAGKPGSLAEALETIQSKEFVDLTHSFSPTTPVWSGFGQATMSAASDPKTHRPYTIEKDGFRASFYSLVGQYGTHIDPPAHFSADGMTMDQIPLKQMVLPLIVFDMTPMLATDPNHALTVDDIKGWERAHGNVPAGAFAALRTDMYKDWDPNPERFKRSPFPAWSLAAIKFLFDERKVTAIGHEALDDIAVNHLARCEKRPGWLARNCPHPESSNVSAGGVGAGAGVGVGVGTATGGGVGGATGSGTGVVGVSTGAGAAGTSAGAAARLAAARSRSRRASRRARASSTAGSVARVGRAATELNRTWAGSVLAVGSASPPSAALATRNAAPKASTASAAAHVRVMGNA